ncbi:MAG: hypothetical protein AMXMBFR16_11440 [Candidatus Uhrbacteria bacterium]
MKRAKTFVVEFNFFTPGTLVTPTSPRCPLESGKVYTVTKCVEPLCYGDEAVVFVEGHEYGVSTEYLREFLRGRASI